MVRDAIYSDRTLIIAQGKNASGNERVGYINQYADILFLDENKMSGYYASKDGHNGRSLEYNAQTLLSHELSHFLSPLNSSDKLLTEDGRYTSKLGADEVNAVEAENIVRVELGIPARTHYDNVYVYGKGIKKSKWVHRYYLVNKKDYAKPTKEYSADVKRKFLYNEVERKEVLYMEYIYSGQRLANFLKGPISSTQIILHGEK